MESTSFFRGGGGRRTNESHTCPEQVKNLVDTSSPIINLAPVAGVYFQRGKLRARAKRYKGAGKWGGATRSLARALPTPGEMERKRLHKEFVTAFV